MKMLAKFCKRYLCLLMALLSIPVVAYSELSDDRINSLLSEVVNAMNKSLPMMLDSEVRLDSVVGMNKTLFYKHTLVNYTADEVDSSFFDTEVRPFLLNQACTTPQMIFALDLGISYFYHFRGVNGKFVSQIVIAPSDCGF